MANCHCVHVSLKHKVQLSVTLHVSLSDREPNPPPSHHPPPTKTLDPFLCPSLVVGRGGVGLGWVGSRPLPGVVCGVTASFLAGHDWTRVTRTSGHKARWTVDTPQTTPSAGVRKIPPCLCVCLFSWWVRGALGGHVGPHGQGGGCSYPPPPTPPHPPHNQNTFRPTESRNVQWREANRRRQRQTNQNHGLIAIPPPPGGAVMKKKKTRSVQYALRWRPVGNRWRLVGNRWRLVGNRWRLVGNRWRLVGNRWRLVGSHQTSESGCHSKKKKGERPYGTPCPPTHRGWAPGFSGPGHRRGFSWGPLPLALACTTGFR